MAQRLSYSDDDRGTLVDLLLRNMQAIPSSPAITDSGTTLTWSQFSDLVTAAALGLDDIGLGDGAVIGLHQPNRTEHLASDLAALSVGATPLTVYATLSPEQLDFIVDDSRMVAAIVEAPYLPMWQALGRDRVRQLIVVDGESDPESGVLSWSDLIERGSRLLAEGGRMRLEQTRQLLTPECPATLVYTSGTTGPPKGVVITNRNIRFVAHHMVERWAKDLAVAVAAQPALQGRDDPLSPGARFLSYLPLAHGAERVGGYAMWLECGSHVTMVRAIDQLPQYLPEVHPSFFIAVPRIWEKLAAGMSLRIAEQGGLKAKLGERALQVAGQWGRTLGEGSPKPTTVLTLQHKIFDRILYRKMRVAMGMDRMAFAVTGAAPIADEVLMRFAGLGIAIVEGYGLTECTAMASSTTIGKPRPGSVGWSFTPEVELRIADDDEILIRGPGNTPGYLHRPEATAELIDAEGWVHTGDLGRLDAGGALSIIGRKKELIINAAGKNMSPNQIELAIKRESPLLAQVVPFGDRQKYVVALVVLEPDGLKEWAGRTGITLDDINTAVTALSQRSDLRAEVEAAITAGNQKLSRVEQIKRFGILDHFWTPPDSPEVTPTMKAKRTVIQERHGAVIRDLYGDDWL